MRTLRIWDEVKGYAEAVGRLALAVLAAATGSALIGLAFLVVLVLLFFVLGGRCG